MKRYMYICTLLINSLAFGYEDLGLPAPELEKGVSGISISSNYKILNYDKSKVDEVKNIYRVIENNNEVLFKATSSETWDNEYLLNLNIGYLKGDTLNSPNSSIVLGTSIDEDSKIGIGFNYSDLEGKYNKIKTKSNGYQIDLFYSKYGFDENLTTILYVGSLDEKFNKEDKKIDNTYWGLHTRYEYLTEHYNELFKGYRIDIEGKQLRQKYQSQKNTNDSIKASLKGILKKEIEMIEGHKIILEVISGYQHEFIENRVYKNLMDDDFRNSINIEGKINYRFDERIEGYISLEGKKSLNTSNTETIFTGGIKYSF
ncbi:MAG: hypothetical protein ACRC4T_06535 [Cetobacterium sp.]